MNSRTIMLTVLAAAIGGLLSIPVMQYFMPRAGQIRMSDPLFGTTGDVPKSR